ncbi:MAG: hypothetical protein ACLFVD_01765 [Dehalococcoidia bacterium]
MKKVLIHVGIAVLCTAIGVSMNIYRVKDRARRHLRRRPVLERCGLVQDDSVLLTVQRDGEVRNSVPGLR